MSAILPIAADSRFRRITATGGQTALAIPFVFQADVDISIDKIALNGTRSTLTNPTHYTLTGAGNPAGGTATLVSGATAGEIFVVIGAAVMTRSQSVVRGGRYRSAATDEDLDRALIRDLELQREGDRSLKLDYGAAAIPEGHFPVAGADGEMLDGGSAADVAGAQGYAEEAKDARDEAVIARNQASDFAALAFRQRIVRRFFGDGVTTTFDLGLEPGSADNVSATWSGLDQDYFTIVGTTIVFEDAPPEQLDEDGDPIENVKVTFGSAIEGEVPPAGSVVTASLADNAADFAKLQDIATGRVVGRKTAGPGDPEELTLSDVLDFIGSATRGDILFRGASAWQRLAAGSSGQFLKTNGAGANPAWAGGGFTSIVIQTFTSDGTYTPTSGMQFCLVEAVGGGGGSGGAKSTAGQFSCGGGGGGAEWVQSRLTAAQIGASKAVAIGAAGTAGAATPGSGAAGGDTTLGTTLVVAKGGSGGTLGNTSNGGAGGAGGTGGTGDVKVNGEAGGPGMYGAIITIAGISGKGGNSRMGPGGAQKYQANTGVGSGNAGNGPGGGASGTVEFNASTGGAGAAGAAGKMVIIEFIS